MDGDRRACLGERKSSMPEARESRAELNTLQDLAEKGSHDLMKMQLDALSGD